VARSLADLDRVSALAAQAGRTDLVARLAQTAERLRSTEVRVAVVGEFKQGKST
jgi:hypothetical protein